MIRLLDRYVLGSWTRLFVLTALGFPLISIVINLTDTLNRLLDKGLTFRQILVSYVYSVPENIFLVMPAAVLFATVFTVGTLSRHSEITAAKASGQSFYRLVLPILGAAALTVLLAIVVGEIAVGATAKKNDIQEAKPISPLAGRSNFVYRADAGWVYTIRALDLAGRRLDRPLLERQGNGPEYPGLVITADSASYAAKDQPTRRSAGTWRLFGGVSRVIRDPADPVEFRFRTMRLRQLDETPADLLTEPKEPEEMRYAELGRYIDALKRSGNDASKLEVERALKIAIPAACFVIALFSAPLAMISPRSGAGAVGIAISLGTTIMFILLAQISRAVGAGGVINPTMAAWIPDLVFLAAAGVLMGRVRT